MSHASNAERTQSMTLLTPRTVILGPNDTCPVLLCPRGVNDMPSSSNKKIVRWPTPAPFPPAAMAGGKRGGRVAPQSTSVSAAQSVLLL